MILHRNLTNHEEKKDGFSMGPQQSAGCATSRGRGTHVTVGSAYSDMVAQEEAAKRHNYGVYIYCFVGLAYHLFGVKVLPGLLIM